MNRRFFITAGIAVFFAPMWTKVTSATPVSTRVGAPPPLAQLPDAKTLLNAAECDQCPRTYEATHAKLLPAIEEIFRYGDSEALVLDDCFARALHLCNVGDRPFTETDDHVLGLNLKRIITPHGVFLVPERGKEAETYQILSTNAAPRPLKIVHANSHGAQECGLKFCLMTVESGGWWQPSPEQ